MQHYRHEAEEGFVKTTLPHTNVDPLHQKQAKKLISYHIISFTCIIVTVVYYTVRDPFRSVDMLTTLS